MRGAIALEGTDLEVVAYVNAGGNLVIRVNKAGVCVADIGILNATEVFTGNKLMEIGALTRPVLRDLKKANVLDMLREHVREEVFDAKTVSGGPGSPANGPA